PSFEDGFELAVLEMRTEPIFEVIDDASPGDRRVDREISSPAQDHEQRSGGINPHHLAVALELPRHHCTAAVAAAEAEVVEQLARVLRPASAIQVGGRGGGWETLHPGAERAGDHVALAPLVIANARIAARGKHVDEAVLGEYLEPDIGIC